MTDQPKPIVRKEDTFDLLDIRLGTIIDVQPEPSAQKPSYRLTVDFGRFGRKTSVARLTKHSIEELKGRQVLGVLNFGARQIGDVLSEVLILGVQFPRADSGEAMFVTPAIEAKLGGKLF